MSRSSLTFSLLFGFFYTFLSVWSVSEIERKKLKRFFTETNIYSMSNVLQGAQSHAGGRSNSRSWSPHMRRAQNFGIYCARLTKRVEQLSLRLLLRAGAGCWLLAAGCSILMLSSRLQEVWHVLERTIRSLLKWARARRARSDSCEFL